MDELVQTVSQRAGIPVEKAQSAVHAVMDFIKQKLPGGVGEQVESFLSSNAESAKGVVGNIAEKVGGMFSGKK
jgi:nucleoid DNA-binding protein